MAAFFDLSLPVISDSIDRKDYMSSELTIQRVDDSTTRPSTIWGHEFTAKLKVIRCLFPSYLKNRSLFNDPKYSQSLGESIHKWIRAVRNSNWMQKFGARSLAMQTPYICSSSTTRRFNDSTTRHSTIRMPVESSDRRLPVEWSNRPLPVESSIGAVAQCSSLVFLFDLLSGATCAILSSTTSSFNRVFHRCSHPRKFSFLVCFSFHSLLVNLFITYCRYQNQGTPYIHKNCVLYTEQKL